MFRLFYSENFCDAPVGLQSGRIKNSQITASSQWNKHHAPWLARLHRTKRGPYIGSWASRHNNHNQWLQIDFRRAMKITGIATQGRQDAVQWVTAYYIYYGYDGVFFSAVKYWWNYAFKVKEFVVFIILSCQVVFVYVINWTPVMQSFSMNLLLFRAKFLFRSKIFSCVLQPLFCIRADFPRKP